jgi:hypothetical protein
MENINNNIENDAIPRDLVDELTTEEYVAYISMTEGETVVNEELVESALKKLGSLVRIFDDNLTEVGMPGPKRVIEPEVIINKDDYEDENYESDDLVEGDFGAFIKEARVYSSDTNSDSDSDEIPQNLIDEPTTDEYAAYIAITEGETVSNEEMVDSVIRKLEGRVLNDDSMEFGVTAPARITTPPLAPTNTNQQPTGFFGKVLDYFGFWKK